MTTLERVARWLEKKIVESINWMALRRMKRELAKSVKVL